MIRTRGVVSFLIISLMCCVGCSTVATGVSVSPAWNVSVIDPASAVQASVETQWQVWDSLRSLRPGSMITVEFCPGPGRDVQVLEGGADSSNERLVLSDGRIQVPFDKVNDESLFVLSLEGRGDRWRIPRVTVRSVLREYEFDDPPTNGIVLGLVACGAAVVLAESKEDLAFGTPFLIGFPVACAVFGGLSDKGTKGTAEEVLYAGPCTAADATPSSRD